MRVLNLYSGIGGNRKLWKDVEVTAVEYNEEIAAIYKEYYPDDKVVIGDAHEYLLKHYKEFDFIWSSPPCQTHSRARAWTSKGDRYDTVYPDMKLWQEIIFMNEFVKRKFVVENVIPYYQPLIKPTAAIDRHLFWANFRIAPIEIKRIHSSVWDLKPTDTHYGFNISNRKIKHRKDQILRNLVNPDLGLYLLEQAQGIIRSTHKTNKLFFDEL